MLAKGHEVGCIVIDRSALPIEMLGPYKKCCYHDLSIHNQTCWGFLILYLQRCILIPLFEINWVLGLISRGNHIEVMIISTLNYGSLHSLYKIHKRHGMPNQSIGLGLLGLTWSLQLSKNPTLIGNNCGFFSFSKFSLYTLSFSYHFIFYFSILLFSCSSSLVFAMPSSPKVRSPSLFLHYLLLPSSCHHLQPMLGLLCRPLGTSLTPLTSYWGDQVKLKVQLH